MRREKRYLRVAPPVARISVPLTSREAVQEAGRLLRELGTDLERMAGVCSRDLEITMTFRAWQMVNAVKRQLDVRARMDQAAEGEGSNTH